MGHFEIKVKAPSKNPKKCPIICFAPDKKNNIPDFQNQRYIGIFMSQRERERERVKERERERERGNKSTGNHISKLPGPEWKSANYTVLYRTEQYSTCS
jgi:hypothetical protein